MLIYLIILGVLELIMYRDIIKAYYHNRTVSSSLLNLGKVLRLVFILASVFANIYIGAKILLISYFIAFHWILNANYSDADIGLYAFIAYLGAGALLFFSTCIGILLFPQF